MCLSTLHPSQRTARNSFRAVIASPTVCMKGNVEGTEMALKGVAWFCRKNLSAYR